MRADLRFRIAEPVERRFGALHAGVMQHQHVDPGDVGSLAAAVVVWRRSLANRQTGHAGCGSGASATRILTSRSCAALIRATRVVASATHSGGRPRAISMSGWLARTKRR